jgi:hypothetical protein
MRRSLLVLLSVAAAAGCGGGGGSSHGSGEAGALPKLPAGFARYDVSGVSFGHPTGWTFAHDTAGLIEYYGAQGTGGFPPQVALGSGPARNSLADSVKLHKGLQKVRHRDYRVTEDRDVRVAGAAGAHRIAAEYSLQRPGHPAAKVREIDLLVLTRDGRQLDFFVRAPVDAYAGGQLDTILGTLHLS